MSVLRTLAGFAALCCLGWTAVAAVGAVQDSKRLILSVTDGDGRPLADLQPDDLRVREDSTDGEVLSVKRATTPLFVQVLIDTTPATEPHVSDLRKAISAFVQRIKTGDPSAQIGLMEFGQAASPIVEITASAEEIQKGIARIFPKPNAGSVLLEGLIAASNSLTPRPSPRRAIVVFNMEPSNEQSRETPNRMFLALGLSGAQVWSVSLQTVKSSNSNRDIVLNDVTRRTGGRREIINSASAIQQYLEAYADVLLAQYELTYRMPVDRAPKVVLTGTTRPGARIHASTLPPQLLPLR